MTFKITSASLEIYIKVYIIVMKIKNRLCGLDIRSDFGKAVKPRTFQHLTDLIYIYYEHI